MIRFKLPPTIIVKGMKYKVVVVKDLKDDDGFPCSGLHDNELKVISIDREQKGRAKRQTFFHEYFHAYLDECNVREGMDSQMEEVVVETLSQALEDNDFDTRWKP